MPRKESAMATKKATGTSNEPERVEKQMIALVDALRAGASSCKTQKAMKRAAERDIKRLRKESKKSAKEIAADQYFYVPHETLKGYVTLNLAALLVALSKVPYDRDIQTKHKAALRKSLEFVIRPFHWALAILRDEKGKIVAIYRLDGQHSATLITEKFELFPCAPELLLTVYECKDMTEVRRAYQAHDLKQSSRNIGDLIMIEYGGSPRLVEANIRASLVKSVVAGLTYDSYGEKQWDSTLPHERLQFVLPGSDFIIWMANLFKGFNVKDTRKFVGAAVVAGIYRAWLIEDREELYTVMRRAISADIETPKAVQAKDAALQLGIHIKTTSVTVSRKLKEIEKLTSYPELYAMTTCCIYHAIHNIHGHVNKLNPIPLPYGPAGRK